MNAVHSNVHKRPVWKIFVKGEDNCKDDETYKYVVRRKGKATNSQVEEDGYFFVNDKDITYDQIMTSHYTSNLDEKLDFVQAFEF